MAVLLMCSLGLGINTASAQADANWPSKPVTLIVPFPAGGGTDLFQLN